MSELRKEMVRMHTEWSKLLAKIDDYIQELEKLKGGDDDENSICIK